MSSTYSGMDSKSSSKSQELALASSQLSLGSNSIGFANTIAQNFKTGSGLTQVCVELVQWLSRECINETDFEYALKLCNSQQTELFPNSSGLEIQNKLSQPDSQPRAIAGISLTTDGSVGRRLALDIDYMYLVTTTLSLMAIHPHAYVVDALCLMVLDNGNHKERVHHPYDYMKTRLKPVMTKIVKSISYNVANSGHDLGGLPSEVKELCQHTTGAGTLAAVAMAVTRNKTGKILIYSSCFYGNIYMWLRHHFHGDLEVSVEGRVLLEKKIGEDHENPKRRVIMLI